MFLTLHDLLTSAVSPLNNAIVISITLKNYNVEFHMMPSLHLEIVEYWELLDQTGKQIDQAIASQNRRDFYLFKLISKKVTGCEKFQNKFEVKFEEGWTFVMHFDPKAQIDKREMERRQVFGAGADVLPT